jgi:hypothetical protein
VVDISPLLNDLTQDERVQRMLRAIFNGEALFFKDKIIRHERLRDASGLGVGLAASGAGG